MHENAQFPQSSAADPNVNLRHYWHIVLERRWLVITAFFTLLPLTALYLVKAPKIYQASVRIQIDRESTNPLNVKDALSLETREQDYLQTQYKNLQSRSLLESVMKTLQLEKDPRYSKEQDPVEALISALNSAQRRHAMRYLKMLVLDSDEVA